MPEQFFCYTISITDDEMLFHSHIQHNMKCMPEFMIICCICNKINIKSIPVGVMYYIVVKSHTLKVILDYNNLENILK